MKKTPRKIGKLPEDGAVFSKGERNKLIFFSVLLLLVLLAFVTSRLQQGKFQQASPDLPVDEGFIEELALPELDLSQIEGRVADADRDGRVLLESEPYDAMFRFVGEYGQVYFDAAPVQELDAAAFEALRSDPAAHRGERYRARGFLEELKSRVRPDGLKEHRGWLRTEGGEAVHFRLHALEENLIVDDFVRLDGMFLKQYEAEGEDAWVTGPLLVGAEAVRSYATPEELDQEQLERRLALVEDDTTESITKLQGPAFDANWMLMARARDAEEIDWAAVPELDNQNLAKLLKEGAAHRGQPFRIPISKNMGARTLDPGENPVRLDRITEGWIGNMTWTAGTGLITYWMPGAAPQITDAQYIQGRGYFLKNLAYVPAKGGLSVVPYFVVTSLEPFVPAESEKTRAILYIVAGVTIGLLILIPALLLRDRRKSEQLQRELVRRRQERRARVGGETGSQAGS